MVLSDLSAFQRLQMEVKLFTSHGSLSLRLCQLSHSFTSPDHNILQQPNIYLSYYLNTNQNVQIVNFACCTLTKNKVKTSSH